MPACGARTVLHGSPSGVQSVIGAGVNRALAPSNPPAEQIESARAVALSLPWMPLGLDDFE